MIRLRKTRYYLAMVLAVVMAVCTFFAVSGLTATAAVITTAPTNATTKVEVKTLYDHHGVDYVVGPIIEYAAADGSYSKGYTDINGKPTNNVYGIPADRYFDADNYLYIENSGTTYTLRGWNPGITVVTPGNDMLRINEQGYIENRSGGLTTNPGTLGIYYDYVNDTCKYMIIVPDYVTNVGTGNGAWERWIPTRSGFGPEVTDAENFTDFSFFNHDLYTKKSNGLHKLNNLPYWSPRERLVGIYFNDSSNLVAFDDNDTNVDSGSGWTNSIYRNKSAFASCNNMHFAVLPNNGKLTTIGRHAFASCSQMIETNIPSSVTTLAYGAYAECSQLAHISIPSSITEAGKGSNIFSGTAKLVDVENNNENFVQADFPYVMNLYGTGYDNKRSELFVVGTSDTDTGKNGMFICKNSLYTGRLASTGGGGAGNLATYESGNWYMTGHAGKLEASGNYVYRLPAKISGDNDARRGNILYDYLNSAGQTVKNTFASGDKIDGYDIGRDMSNQTWCMNIVIPNTVQIIGDNAFYFAHVQYMETYATTLGYHAFYDNHRSTFSDSRQYYYIHNDITNAGTDALRISDAGNVTIDGGTIHRVYIFETNALYTTYESRVRATTSSSDALRIGVSGAASARWEIPVIANVDSADGDVVIKESDMSAVFYNDSEYLNNTYKTVPASGANGEYSIIYTKRLSGHDFTYVKQPNGSWLNPENVPAGSALNNPGSTATIGGMKSTVWYSDPGENGYKTVTTPAGAYSSSSTGSINIYTKKIALPTLKHSGATANEEYTFGGDDVNENASVGFDRALLADESYNDDKRLDYVVTLNGSGLDGFTYPGDRASSTEPPTVVHNAGTYRLYVSLNEKWGAWEDDYKRDSRYGEVKVARQIIDLGLLSNYPLFTTGDGTVLSGGAPDGSGSELFYYAEGWFLNKQGTEPIDTATVINSYTRYLNSQITLSHEWEGDDDALFRITYNRGTQSATDSSRNYTYFSLRVKTIGESEQTNYEFSDASLNANANDFSLRGMVVSNVQGTSALLRKCWYIVMQSNWFIDSEATLDTENPLLTPSYKLATVGTGADMQALTSWTYEDAVTVHMPKPAYGQITPTINIYFGSLDSVPLGVIDENNPKPLAYYINPAMPAGKYFVVIHSDETTVEENGETATYPAADETITFEVLPKELDVDDIVNAIMTGTEDLDDNGFPVYSFAADGHIHLHGDNVNEALAALNEIINGEYGKAVESSNFWFGKTDYYGSASITYNLDRWGNSDYVTSTYNSLPTAADKYTVYYCVSAKNYKDYGGESDAARRDKKFITIIYTSISVKTDLLKQVVGGNDIYFKNIVYTGDEAHTLVPYSQYYSYDFTDTQGYINARNKATVRLTLNNPDLAKWNLDVDVEDGIYKGRFAIDTTNPAVLIAYYDITSAPNSWTVTPSISGWSYDGFDKDVHTVSSRLRFTETTAYYRIWSEETRNWVNLGSYGVTFKEENNYFTVTNGVVDKNIADILSALKPGYYRIYGYADAYRANPNGIPNVSELVPQADDEGIRIHVNKAANRWTSSPNVVRWNWSEYNKSKNLITAIPLYLNIDDVLDGKTVKFTILNSDGTVINPALTAFTEVTEEVENALKALGANKDGETYFLLATVEETDYYFGLNELPEGMSFDDFATIEGEDLSGLNTSAFDIAKFNNFWETSPGMTGWQYMAYSADTNFVAGDPKFIKDGTEVTYYVYKNTGATAPTAAQIMTGEKFTDIADVKDFLTGSKVGQYYFLATAAGTDNFTDMSVTVPFRITTNQTNRWTAIPSITGWVYEGYAASGLTEGKATFGTPEYTVYVRGTNGEYKPVDNYSGIAFAVLQNMLAGNVSGVSTLDAGTYRLEVISKDGNNEGEDANFVAATRTLDFVIDKAENGWTTEGIPKIEGWTWGSTANTPAVATTTKPNGGVNALYYVASSDGTYSGNGVKDAPKDAGLYAYVTTAIESTNYNELVYVSFFEIKQFENDWLTAPEATLSWTYGIVVDGSSKLATASAKKGDVQFAINGQTAGGDDIIEVNADSTDIVEKLQALGAGTYSVTATVTGSEKTFTSISATTSVTVNKANLSWKDGTAPADTTWIWGVEDKDKNFVAPVAVGTVQGQEIEIAVSYKFDFAPAVIGLIAGESNKDVETASKLVETIKGGHAGVYTVKVTATDENYNDFGGTVVITIEQATNNWTANEPTNRENYYQQFTASQFMAPVASKGEKGLKYSLVNENNTLSDIILEEGKTICDWVNGCDAETYIIRVEIPGANDYKVLSKDITVKVLPAERSWTNSGYTKNEEQPFNVKFGITVPRMDPIADRGGSVTYAVTYSEIGSDKQPVDLELTEAELGDLNNYFNSAVRDAGVYKITATYASGNKNIQSLEHTATVTITKKNVSFGNTMPPDLESYVFEGVTLTVPDAGFDNTGKKHVISYSIRSGSGVSSTPEIGDGENQFKTIVAYLNTLGVGTYTLTTSIVPTTNYNGLSIDTTIIITKAPNGWASGTTPSARLNLTRGDSLTDFTQPAPQRGTMTFTIEGTNYQNVSIGSLISTLEGLSAGTYTVKYSVPDDNVNFDGFNAEMQFVMSLQGNSWTTRLNAAYSLTWESSGIAYSESFTSGVCVPVASNENNNVVKFEIASLTAGVTAPQINSADDFENWLNNVGGALKAGTYSVRYFVDATSDHAGLEGTSTITIGKKANSLTAAQTGLTWKFDGTDEENALPSFTADYGVNEIVYSINGVEVKGNIRLALNALSVGRYTLRAEIEESDNYRMVFTDVTVTVIQNENGWDLGTNNEYEFKISETEIKNEQGETVQVTGWQWGNISAVGQIWNAPRPKQGGVVNITVTRTSSVARVADEVVITFELRYTKQDDGTVTSNVRDFEELLRALNAGEYIIQAEIPENDNWSVPSDGTKTINFRVLANVNEFEQVPVVHGWDYGNSRNLPQNAQVKYGNASDIVYTYYYLKADGTEEEVSEFTRAGNYKFTAYLAASPEGNYPELSYTGTFEINRINTGWQTLPGITAWTWNEFDAETNLFTGAAVSGGAVTFTIYDGDRRIGTFHPDNKGVITGNEVETLKAMGAGNYTYVIEVEETINYLPYTSARQTLTVGQATNRWTTYPTVIGWAENLWSSGNNMPEAESRYGDVLITITGAKTKADGSVTENYVWFNALYRDKKPVQDFADYKNELHLAPGGIYSMRGYVAEVGDKYEGLDDTARVEVFLSSSTRPANHWTILPAISNWTAGEGEGPAMMQGEAYRQSRLIKTFYYEVDDERGKPVPASELNADGYPTEPGKYVMHLTATFEDVAYDTIETEVSFEIYKRVIKWTVSPNITDWSYAGTSSTPVADINFSGEEGSSITYAYKRKGEDDDKAVSTLYTQPGEYVMIVTAKAKYCDTVVAYVDYKVTLSANQWLDLPVIESWSEEFGPNDPTGKALIGEVVYTYATADGVDLGQNKPTTEGSYIMYATVKVEGYEDLTTPEGYAFTITPAYDVTLLTVDIVLSSVLCALTVVVIVFAIRRYKENG